jgi:trimethylamine--corrinoid protein Co-methyltransferase
MLNPSKTHPHLGVLNEEQKERVHHGSLEILSTVGVRVDSERARELFRRALGSSALDEGRVYIPSDLVAWAIEAAPATLDVYDRRGNLAFQLGRRQTHFGIGVTNLFYQDPETDDIAPFHRRHMRTSVRLGNTLPNIDLVSTVGILRDLSPDVADLYATLEMVANTVKPLVVLVSEEPQFPFVLDMLEHLCGELAPKPFVIPYVNPVTPLVINRGTVDKMFVTIERGLPLIYSSYGMAGMSTPITPGGTLMLLNAELLAGLVLSQLVRENAPVILGILPMAFDMREMVPLFDSWSFLLNLACAEMMVRYEIPHSGTSGSGDGWTMDIVAAGTMWTNHLTSVLGQIGLCPFVGSGFGSKVFAPHMAVYADEVIARVKRMADGFSMDDEALSLAEVKQAGPGGSFLASDQTFRLFRDAYFSSDIFPLLDLERWLEEDSPQAIDFLRRRTRHLLEDPRVPEDCADLIGRGESFISTTE